MQLQLQNQDLESPPIQSAGKTRRFQKNTALRLLLIAKEFHDVWTIRLALSTAVALELECGVRGWWNHMGSRTTFLTSKNNSNVALHLISPCDRWLSMAALSSTIACSAQTLIAYISNKANQPLVLISHNTYNQRRRMPSPGKNP